MNTALKKPLALLLIVALLLSAAVPAFSVPAQAQTVSALSADRPDFLEFLNILYNNPLLRVVFAPLLLAVQIIYNISVWLAMR